MKKTRGIKETKLVDVYEYPSPEKLDSISGSYFAIPASVILENTINEKRAAVFSFFSIRKGLDYSLLFSVNSISKWLRKQPDRHKNGVNDKIIQIIEYLKDKEYVTFYEKLKSSSCIEANFNLSKVLQECEHERFSIIYLDEINKILDYNDYNTKDSYMNNEIVLLVFAYLRMNIFRRKNKLFPEEVNLNDMHNTQYDIETRKEYNPDAYNCFYYEIAEDLGLSSRVISRSVEILNELKLIYSEPLPRVKYYDDDKEKWMTDHTIFCNWYKREGSYLLDDGEKYYLTEIENKKKKLNITYKNKKSKNKKSKKGGLLCGG